MAHSFTANDDTQRDSFKAEERHMLCQHESEYLNHCRYRAHQQRPGISIKVPDDVSAAKSWILQLEKHDVAKVQTPKTFACYAYVSHSLLVNFTTIGSKKTIVSAIFFSAGNAASL